MLIDLARQHIVTTTELAIQVHQIVISNAFDQARQQVAVVGLADQGHFVTAARSSWTLKWVSRNLLFRQVSTVLISRHACTKALFHVPELALDHPERMRQ